MLTIRDDQLEALAALSREDFAKELARFVREEAPDKTGDLNSAQLLEKVKLSIRAAVNSGLRDTSQIAGFVSLQFSVGERFHEHPAVQRILSDASIPEERRIQALLALIPASTWAEISRACRSLPGSPK